MRSTWSPGRGREAQRRHELPRVDARVAACAAADRARGARCAARAEEPGGNRLSKKVLLAAPRSFCAGVDRAIEIVELLLGQHGPPVYVGHQIVHNDHVVKRLEG